eukprot:jgi/Tetstr1/452011/TSEL_039047.t1
MDVSVLAAANEALVALADPFRLLMLSAGVLLGLFLGIVPGIGGIAGMALLLPFTFTMDSYAAFAMLLGMSAVTGTSDTIPAILFGVPGTAGAQATVMDGHPMAKKGEAGRALSAAFTASLIGGLVGAFLLALAVPVLRPVILNIGSPELLGFSVFGIAMVAVLSGTSPLRGLTVAGLGILLSMIDLAIKRSAIASEMKYDTRKGMGLGFRDAISNWWIVLRGGGLGAVIGAIPGLGSSVVDWIAYGWASQTVKDSDKSFGKGDVRGVIAPESANNAITAGSLVPTIAFGVPGSASMAILLSVFLIHGLVPGPDMLGENLNVTYSMVWSIAIANILGAGICFAFSGQLAKIAILRYTLILPAVLVFVYVGAFQSSRNWGDLYALLIFAVIGWTMKQLRWPRPPLILGFVLGSLIERYMFISTSRYGLDWLSRPLVIILFAGAALLLIGPLRRHFRFLGGIKGVLSYIGSPKIEPRDLFYVGAIALAGYAVFVAWGWSWGAKVGPMVVGVITLTCCVVSLLNQVFARGVHKARAEAGEVSRDVHMDTAVDHGDITRKTMFVRAATFLGYLLAFIILMATIGIIPTVPVFVVAYMWLEGRENWKLIAGQALALTAVVYLVFDQLLRIPWPETLVGSWVPALTIIPSV